MRARSQSNGARHVALAGVLTLMLTGVYNSILVNSDSFMGQDWGIKFVKRLDELQGKITVGRMAASTMSWTALEEKKAKELAKVKPVKAVKQPEPKIAKAEPVEDIAEPAIQEDLSLKLDQVFFKKPLDKGSFSGHARTVDGYIEEIVVNLPDGKSIFIDTRDRMVGNVFTYEDTQTGEVRSGMFYEVKKGSQYMITLTNDSAYGGLRLGFSTTDYSELRYDDPYTESNVQWANSEPKAESQPANNAGTESGQGQSQGGEGQSAYSFNFDQSA